MARILLCEDDPVFRSVAELALQERGHTVVAVGDGAAARRELAEGAYDLLLTDILMPAPDGLELIAEQRKLRPTLPVLAVTAGLPQFRDLLQTSAALLGANAVLRKPVAMPALIAAVDALLLGGNADG